MTSALQKIITPRGETMIVMPEAEYEALLDAADIADAHRVLAEIESGRQEWVPSEIVDRLLEGENRIRVWREHRGLTAADLAAKAKISAAYLSELETGKKTGTVETLRKLANVLKLDIDDLVP
jgi:ribosome-binding protein aMBF1 (putative translation factor)